MALATAGKLNRETLVDQLTAQLRQQVIAGRLRANEPVPSERELCDAFAVGRTTVRESLHRLLAYGYLERRNNQLVVVDPLRLPAAEADCAALAAQLSVADVFEVRRTLETRAVELACRHWSHDDLAPLRESLECMHRRESDESYHAANAAFHVSISRVGKNIVLASVYEASAHLFFKLPTYWRVFGGGAPSHDAPRRAEISGWRAHQALFDAIEARDEAAAVRCNDDMLDRVQRTLIARLAGAA